MGELDLDKIERTYSPLTYKKYELESIRNAAGLRRTSGTRIIRRDLTKESRRSTDNSK